MIFTSILQDFSAINSLFLGVFLLFLGYLNGHNIILVLLIHNCEKYLDTLHAKKSYITELAQIKH